MRRSAERGVNVAQFARYVVAVLAREDAGSLKMRPGARRHMRSQVVLVDQQSEAGEQAGAACFTYRAIPVAFVPRDNSCWIAQRRSHAVHAPPLILGHDMERDRSVFRFYLRKLCSAQK